MTQAAVELARPLPELAGQATDQVLPMRVACDYASVGAVLPDVIDELHVHIVAPGDEPARRLALETLIEACVPATDLAYVAVRHAQDAAAVLPPPGHLKPEHPHGITTNTCRNVNTERCRIMCRQRGR
jgi:hypothetical protein